MHIGFTYDLQTDPADARQVEFDPPSTIRALQQALASLGHHVTLMGSATDLLDAGPKHWCDIDLVFNIAEGTHGRCREAWVPMLLEQWGIPFVGSGVAAQMLGLDKVMSKRLARAVGIPTPRWWVAERADTLAHITHPTFPLIVKPRYEGSGRGIDPGAIVHDVASLQKRVEWLTTTLRESCLIEEFVSFGELTVLLIGNTPPHALPAVQRPIDLSSRLASHVAGGSTTQWLCPVELTPELDVRARQLAVTMFETLRCRDMARVDLRVDEQGRLYFLEINPLPSFDPEGTVGLMAEYLGTTYTQLVGRILEAARLRLGCAPRAVMPRPTMPRPLDGSR